MLSTGSMMLLLMKVAENTTLEKQEGKGRKLLNVECRM
jgi:hypothetical protein